MKRGGRKSASAGCALLLAASAIGLRAAPTLAVNSFWDGGAPLGNTSWSTAANWSGDVVPPAINDITFGTGFGSGTNILTNGNRTVNALNFIAGMNLSISGGPTDAITITSGRMSAADEGNYTINTAIAVGASSSWFLSGPGIVQINGPINQATAGIIIDKIQPGLLVLTNGSGNFNGELSIDAGVVQLSSVWNGVDHFYVSPGSGMHLSGATVGSPIYVGGDGVGGSGALRAVSSSTLNGPIQLIDQCNIHVATGTLTINGVISDFGGKVISKNGPGELRLTAANTYGGKTIINEGTLSVISDAALGGGPVDISLGRLFYTSTTSATRNFTITNGRLQVASGANVTLIGSQVVGGFIAGPGKFSTTNGAFFSGVTTFAGSNIQATGPTTLVNFTNGGSLTISTDISWDGGTNIAGGSITLSSGSSTFTGFSNAGIININNSATLVNFSNNLASGGGSRISISPGGTLNVFGASLNLDGALLVNNGSLIGTTNVNYGSLAKGAGSFGAVNVTDGGKFSPGNSPGSVITGAATWNSGGSYLVEIGASGRDFWEVSGQLNLNSSAAHPFIVEMASLDDLIFDNTRDYNWPILHADGGIVGADGGELALDVSAFKSDLGAGHFFLQSTSTDLSIGFSAVPEPGLWGLVIALGVFAGHRRSDRNREKAHGC